MCVVGGGWVAVAPTLSPCQLSSRRGQDQPRNSHTQGWTGRYLSCTGRGVLCEWEGGDDTAQTMGSNAEHTSTRLKTCII